MNATSSSERGQAGQLVTADHDITAAVESAYYLERHRTKVPCRIPAEGLSNLKRKALMKNKSNYVGTSTATLTQSGLLAEMLRHRRQVIELARRREHGEQRGGFFRNSLSWLMGHGHSITAERGFRHGMTLPRHT